MEIEKLLINQYTKNHHPLKATKFRVLKLIKEREIVTVNDLVDHFGYEPQSATTRLYSLAKEGLITKWSSPGQWCLTQQGERRLNYYAGKAKGSCAISVALAGDAQWCHKKMNCDVANWLSV